MKTLVAALYALVFPLFAFAEEVRIFEDLQYGDDREAVTKKLLANDRVSLVHDETFLARVGLNGAFKTSRSMGGQDLFLYFNWDNNGGLQEVSLRSKGSNVAGYVSTERQLWKQASAQLTKVFGKPFMENPQPKAAEIPSGSILNTHLWHNGESGGSILLGFAKQGDQFSMTVRFTKERITPIAIP